MAEVWDEERLVTGGFERVLVEVEWYDGLRRGFGPVGGAPHYFAVDGDFRYDGGPEPYLVWPASEDAVRWELESWALFVAWNDRYEAGTAGPDSHPGQGGVDARYDELERLLAPHREVPDGALRFEAETRFGAGRRYRLDGLPSWMRWRPRT